MNVGLDRPMLLGGTVVIKFGLSSKRENFWVCIVKDQQLWQNQRLIKHTIHRMAWISSQLALRCYEKNLNHTLFL